MAAVLILAAGFVADSPARASDSAADASETAGAASSISGSQFDPGYIISDAQFYESDAMTQAEIQAFLNAKCPTNNCINVITTTSTDRIASNMCPGGYVGVANESTAAIIFKVQASCGISSKALLVTLQKEQGLVTKQNPSTLVLRKAMGYGCPDTSSCDSTYYGLFNQLYAAASQFKRYGLRTSDNVSFRTKFQIGIPYNIYYNPNSACGTRSVTVKNMATTALYYYTPYTPNAAALANLGGLGDSCSSYGNRNFWAYYYAWFGSPVDLKISGVEVSRLGGNDRFETAVNISKANYDASTTTVYIANGLDYPDALSAAPSAAMSGSPLLLVRPNFLPAAVIAEIERLSPDTIVVVGGTASVSDEVVDQLGMLASNVTRIAGTNRYETSQLIAAATFPSGATTAYVATGAGFPDALSASAAAGSQAAPLILIRGLDGAVDAETAALLTSLGVTRVVIAGGTAVVSDAMQASLATVPGVVTVDRVAGRTRYDVSSSINHATFTSGPTVFIASGSSFPDALAGAALAGKLALPLYLAPSSCLHRPVLQDMIDFGTTKMVLLGGGGVLGSGVVTFVNCS